MSDPRVADEVLVNLAVVRGNLQQVWRSVDELRASARGAESALDDVEVETSRARLTTDPANTQYSDTAIFITDYLANMIRKPADLRNQKLLDRVYTLARSKFAIMDAGGDVATIGEFIDDHGLLFSNNSYEMYQCR